MGEVFVRVCVDNEERGIWRISENQWEIIDALKSLGAISNNVAIEEISIRLMN